MTGPLFALLLALLPELPGRVRRWAERRAPSGALAAVAAIVLVAAYAAHVAIVSAEIAREGSPAFATLPIRFTFVPLTGSGGRSATDAVLLLSLVEVAALAVFSIGVGRLHRPRAVACIVLAGACLFGISLGATAADSADAYSYVGLAELGLRAYDPPATAFPGDLAVINVLWGRPILPSTYGPAYLGLAWIAMLPAATLAAKLLAVRLVSGVAVLALPLLAWKLGHSRATVAALAVNPGMMITFVTNAHNDLIAADFALGAILLLRSRWIAWGVLCAVVAVLVKVTVLPGALLALVALPKLRVRIAAGTAIAAGAALAYALATHLRFVHDLEVVSRAYASAPTWFDTSTHALAIAVVCGTVASALAVARVRASAAWTFGTLGAFSLPSYLAWALPCAIFDDDVALGFALVFPYVSVDLATIYPETSLWAALRFVVLDALLLAVAVRVMRRFADRRAAAARARAAEGA